MEKISRNILRFLVALSWGVIAFASYAGLLALLMSAFEGLWLFIGLMIIPLAITMGVASLVVMHKVYKGWGMPAYLMAPPPSSTPED